MDEAVFLEVDGPDGKSYGYFCPFCANQMMKDDHARLPNTGYVPLNTKHG